MIACAIYRLRVEQYPGRLVMLCDRARCWRGAIGPRRCRGEWGMSLAMSAIPRILLQNSVV
jgi:hypothetical protein